MIAKVIFAFCLTVAALAELSAQPIKVTFLVNSALFPDTLMPHHVVQIRGGFLEGSPGIQNPEINRQITWDSESLSLTNMGGRYWRGSINVLPGDRLNFKFWAGANKDRALSNRGWSGNSEYWEDGWEGGQNRLVTIPESQKADTVLPEIWMGYTNNVIQYPTKKDSLSILISLAARNLIVAERISLNDTLFVEGKSFSNGEATLFSKRIIPENRFKNFPEGSKATFAHFYHNFITFPKYGVDSVHYRFKADSLEFQKPSFGFSFRSIRFPKRDSSLQWVGFNNEPLTNLSEFRTDTVNFRVNMLPMEKAGLFDTSKGDRLVIRGNPPFAQNDSLDYSFIFSKSNNENLFFLEKTFKERLLTRFEYRYTIVYDTSRFDPNHPNYNQNIARLGTRTLNEMGSVGMNNFSKFSFFQSLIQSSRITDFDDTFAATFIESGASIKNNSEVIKVTLRVNMQPATNALTNSKRLFTPDDSVYIIFEKGIGSMYLDFETGEEAILKGKNSAEHVMKKVRGTQHEYEKTLYLKPPLNAFLSFRTAYGKPAFPQEMVVNGKADSDFNRFLIKPEYMENKMLFLDRYPVVKLFWPDSTSFVFDWKQKELIRRGNQYCYVEETPVEGFPPDYWTEPWCDDFLPEWMYTNSAVKEPRITPSISLTNFPNPFNPSTVIQYNVPTAGRSVVTVYSIDGRKIAELKNQLEAAGSHQIIFDASRLSSGVYLYTLVHNGKMETRRMVLLK